MAFTPASIPAAKSANENSTPRRDASADPVAEDDYQSFCEALGGSARGRAFLAEYARRNRHADTEVVLEALGRLEETARAHKPAAEADRIRQDLRALLDTLRTAKPQTENSPSAIKAATLSALIDFTQARLEALVTMPDDLRALEALAEVPPPEQPELPIPQPLAATPAAPVMRIQPAAEPAKGGLTEPTKAGLTETLTTRPHTTAAPEAIGIPKVEFDYQAQLATRPAAPATGSAAMSEAAAWSELSPPPVAATKTDTTPDAKADAAPEVKAEAKPEAKPEAKLETAIDATIAATVEPTPAPEEIAPIAATVESTTAIETAPAPHSTGESGRVAAAGEVETCELWLDDLTVDVTATNAGDNVAIAPLAMPALEMPAPQMPAAAPPSLTATALGALVERLQRPTPPGAAAPTIGKIAAADPLAPILSLSDDERLALFT